MLSCTFPSVSLTENQSLKLSPKGWDMHRKFQGLEESKPGSLLKFVSPQAEKKLDIGAADSHW